MKLLILFVLGVALVATLAFAQVVTGEIQPLPFKAFQSGGNCVYVGKYVLVAVPVGPGGC